MNTLAQQNPGPGGSTLVRLTNRATQLAWLKAWQGLLALLWMAGLVGFLTNLFSELSDGVVVVFVLIPFAIAALASLQSWWRRRTLGLYKRIRTVLRTGRALAEHDRREARAVLYEFQVSSQPPLVRDDLSRSVMLGLLIASFAVSVIVALLAT